MKLLLFISIYTFCTLLSFPDNALKAQQSKGGKDSVIKYDDTRKFGWDEDFEEVSIKSSADNSIQKAYFYRSRSTERKPLIVSLHTWSGDYTQRDSLAKLCRQNDINYIHPDFRGPNKTKEACCSDLVIADINDAIEYAINHSNVEVTKISIIGVSGGGYVTLCCFMKLNRQIHSYSAWASITDLQAWHDESVIRKNNYDKNIQDCTCSQGELNKENARQRSPLYFSTPESKIKQARLYIYAGVYDGIQGSVPITHSINFYNKILEDVGEEDHSVYVSDKEKLELLEFRRPLREFGYIETRKICLLKEIGNIKLTIFEGNHEMLEKYAFDELLND